jgi:hypothetical protein
MKAGPIVVGQLLQNRNRYKVPIYQRNYVWNREKQWEPFWSDVRTKATERLAGRQQRFSHYMGAIVLETRGGFSARRVPTYQVVDGQQRLTTFQLFLAAARDYAKLIEHKSAEQNIVRYIMNAESHLMEDPEVEIYKVWPTEQNRELYTIIVKDGREALRVAYRQYFYVKRDLIYDYSTTPRMLAGYGYFFDRIKEAVEKDALQEELIEPATEEVTAEIASAEPDHTLPWETKLDAIWQSLVEEFKVVEIILEDGDDAQIIFETLNERGEPLLATDLVRNNIFHRAEEEDRQKAETLFRAHWTMFEEPFWGFLEKQGRYKKQRIEFFLANYIACQIAADVTITKLFSEYKSFLKTRKFAAVDTELKELARFGRIYRQIIERTPETGLGRFAKRLVPWDVTTVFPLAMQIWARSELADADKDRMLGSLISFIVRRAVCGLTPKNYNKLFLAAISNLNEKSWSVDALDDFLLRQTAESGRWPRDEEFERRWCSSAMYAQLQPARTRAILEELECSKRTRFHETTELRSGLTVEHILPENWRASWQIKGEKPSDLEFNQAIWATNEDDSVVGRIVRRNRLKHSVGNLTLLTQPLNSSVSNGPYEAKRAALQSAQFGSLLVLNREITDHDVWDEETIEARSANLFTLARAIWACPEPGIARA